MAESTRSVVALDETLDVQLDEFLFIRRVRIADLKEQDVNAHVMTDAMQERLSENIRIEGHLESLPYCVQLNDGPVEIVSGHHRIRAARAAGLEEIVVLVDTKDRTRSQVVSKQLAHNALVGFDDTEILMTLISEMKSVDDLLASGLPEELLPTPERFEVTMFTPHADFKFKIVKLTFLQHQIDDLKTLANLSSTEAPALILTGYEEQFSAFIKAVAAFGRERDIVSAATAIAVLTDIALEQVRSSQADKEDEEKPEE